MPEGGHGLHLFGPLETAFELQPVFFGPFQLRDILDRRQDCRFTIHLDPAGENFHIDGVAAAGNVPHPHNAFGVRQPGGPARLQDMAILRMNKGRYILAEDVRPVVVTMQFQPGRVDVHQAAPA